MASICKPIIPSGVLTQNNLPTAADLAILARAVDNPILKYDAKQIRLLTVLTNSLLQNTNLDPYPSLKNRINQSAITEEEFADFLDDSGLTPNYIEETYTEDFPVQIDIKAINEAINEISNALNELTAQILNDNNTTTLDTPDDIEDNIFDPTIPISDTITWIPDDNNDNILTQLDEYYEENFSAALNASDLCAALSNPFTKLASLISAASFLADAAADIIGFAGRLKDKVDGFVNSIKNFSIANLVKSLQSKLANIKQQLLEVVDNFKESLRKDLVNLKRRATELMNDIVNVPRALSRLISKKLRQIEDFLSDFNTDRMKAKLKAIFTINEDQFEDLLPNVLNLLGLKACALGKFIEGIMKKPVDLFKAFLITTALNFDILQNKSVERIEDVVRNGGRRINPNDKKESKDRQAERSNESPPDDPSEPVNPDGGEPFEGLAPKRHVVLDMTSEERTFVEELTSDYKDLFEFNATVKNMGVVAREVYEGVREPKVTSRPEDHWRQWADGENRPESGWKMVAERHPYIYAALARVSRKLRSEGYLSGPLRITSAYRSRYYNRIYLRETGAAYQSPHMHAMALDVADVASGLTEEGSAKFVEYCSQEGFTRFGVYSGFIHIDIDAGGPPIFRNSRSSDLMSQALENHRNRNS